MKNFKFYIFSILLILIIVELFSFISLKGVKKLRLIQLLEESYYDPKIIEKYSEFIPYSRNKIDFSELNNYIVKGKGSYFYSEINNFNIKNKENILIQGDSWAEIANKKKIFSYLQNFATKNNFGLINAGIGSYSPSPMTSQLYILRKEFNIKPTILISIIDQTDIGDELYRYRSLDKSSFSPVITNMHKDFYKNITKDFNKTNLSIIKLAHFSKSYFNLHKTIYEFNNFQTFKFILKKFKAKLFRIALVLYPLKYGLNENEKLIFEKRINNYIDIGFSDKNLKKIYFVTHPHKNHLFNKTYQLDVGNLINEIISKSNYSENLELINFSNLNILFDEEVFEKGDPFSHLTVNSYAKYYYPTIMDKVKN